MVFVGIFVGYLHIKTKSIRNIPTLSLIKDRTMALTDIAIRNAKAKEKPYKLSDSGGLFILITTSGGKLWRYSYRFDGIYVGILKKYLKKTI